jgi:hypothetical protein
MKKRILSALWVVLLLGVLLLLWWVYQPQKGTSALQPGDPGYPILEHPEEPKEVR